MTHAATTPTLRARVVFAAVAAAAFLLVHVAAAQATFPGTNGPIAIVRGGHVYLVAVDVAPAGGINTGKRDITNIFPVGTVLESAAWSADGSRIAFTRTLPFPGTVS